MCVCTINSISLFVVLWIEWNEPQTPKRLENQEARSLVKKTAFFLRLLQKNRSILVQPTGFILDCCPISFCRMLLCIIFWIVTLSIVDSTFMLINNSELYIYTYYVKRPLLATEIWKKYKWITYQNSSMSVKIVKIKPRRPRWLLSLGRKIKIRSFPVHCSESELHT